MSYNLCDNCEEYAHFPGHTCPPEWEIQVDGYHWDDHDRAFGITPRQAVEWYLRRNRADMDFAMEIDARVRKKGCQWRSFTVNVEMEPKFYIRESYTTEQKMVNITTRKEQYNG